MLKPVLAAEGDLPYLFYGAKSISHMWWYRFDIRLNNAFAVLDKNACCQVHTYEMNLRLHNKKVR